MNQCIVCGKECKGKCCGGACRAKKSRRARAHDVKRTAAVIAKPMGIQVEPFETSVTVEATTMIANYGQPDCECQHCKTNRANGNRHTINHGEHKTADQLSDRELNRVTLPGDVDYKKSGVIEHCQSCDAILPQLEQPRVHTGTCYPCSSGQAHTATAGHTTEQGQRTANG